MKGVLCKRHEVLLTAIKSHASMPVAHHCHTGLSSHHFLLPPSKQNCTKGKKVHLQLQPVLSFSSALGFPSAHLAHIHTKLLAQQHTQQEQQDDSLPQ